MVNYISRELFSSHISENINGLKKLKIKDSNFKKLFFLFSVFYYKV